MKRWLAGWIIASLVAPLGYLAVCFAFGGKTTASLPFDIFWPGSLMLMVLENRPPITTAALIWMMSIGTNVLLYAAIALLLWPLIRLRSRRLRKGKV